MPDNPGRSVFIDRQLILFFECNDVQAFPAAQQAAGSTVILPTVKIGHFGRRIRQPVK
jgi:predicted enzyme related to lactoylglutathione lyase